MATMSSSNDIIIKEPPRSLIKCAHCQKPGPPKQCPACRCSYYCNEECQKAHGKEHETWCNKIRTYIQTKKEHATEILREVRERRDKQKPEYECIICSETQVTEQVPSITLDCDHSLCYGCLRKWEIECSEQGRDHACPLCRAEVPLIDLLVGERSCQRLRAAELVQSKVERDEICSAALSGLESILQIHPGIYIALHAKGKFLVIMERYEDAVNAFTKAINALLHREDCLRQSSGIETILDTEPQDAIDLDAFSRNGPSIKGKIWLLLDLIDAYIEIDDFETVDELFTTYEETASRVEDSDWREERSLFEGRWLSLQVKWAYRTGEYEDALDMMKEMVMTLDLCKISALCYKGLGDFDTAVSIIAGLYYYHGPFVGERRTNEYLQMWSEIEAERIERQSS